MVWKGVYWWKWFGFIIIIIIFIFLPELCVVTVRTVKRPTEILAGTWIYWWEILIFYSDLSTLPTYGRSRMKQKKESQ